MFGPEFECTLQDIAHWLSSESFLCSAVINASEQDINIRSVCSMVVVTESSARRLMLGSAKERDLVPFDSSFQPENPVLYYSSLIANSPNDAKFLLRSIFRDIVRYKQKYDIELVRAISIPTTDNAVQHLRNAGFFVTSEHRYLEKYAFMEATSASVVGRYWKSLLNMKKCLTMP